MPTTTEAHRASIGLFYPVLVRIINRKRRNSDPSRRHSQKCSTTKRVHKLVCVHDTFRAVLLVRFTADTMHGRGEKPWTWPKPHLHEYVAKHAGCHGMAFFGADEQFAELHCWYQPEIGR